MQLSVILFPCSVHQLTIPHHHLIPAPWERNQQPPCGGSLLRATIQPSSAPFNSHHQHSTTTSTPNLLLGIPINSLLHQHLTIEAHLLDNQQRTDIETRFDSATTTTPSSTQQTIRQQPNSSGSPPETTSEPPSSATTIQTAYRRQQPATTPINMTTFIINLLFALADSNVQSDD